MAMNHQMEAMVDRFADVVDAAADGRRLPGEECVSTLSRKSSGVGSLRVVTKVVTGSMSGQFVLEKCPIRWDSNPPLGDGIRSTRVYITSFFLRNQTYFAHFSEFTFYGSINKTNNRSYSCFT